MPSIRRLTGLLAATLSLAATLANAQPAPEPDDPPQVQCTPIALPLHSIDPPPSGAAAEGNARVWIEYRNRLPMVDEPLRNSSLKLKQRRVHCRSEVVSLHEVHRIEPTPHRGPAIHWRPLAELHGDAAEAADAQCIDARRANVFEPRLSVKGEGMVGSVIADLRFSGPDTPPEVLVRYASDSTRMFSDEVIKYYQQFRSCAPVQRFPVTVRKHFRSIDSAEGLLLFPLEAISLAEFLKEVKGQGAGVRFDFTTMNCPFDIAWKVGKPAVANQVGEFGEPDPQRARFLRWMGDRVMDLRKREFERVLGSVARIHVPCGQLEDGKVR